MSPIKLLAIVSIALALAPIVTFCVLPPLLRACLGVKTPSVASQTWRDRVELRYQNQHTSVWMFAWFKLRLDPMFHELPQLIEKMPNIRAALDLGCGLGVAGSSLLEWLPDLILYGIDPNPKRVRAASLAFGRRGHAFQAGAPDFELPALPPRFDAVFFLDVLHYLPDPALELTLRRIRSRLNDGGYLVIRAPMPSGGSGSLFWNLDKLAGKFTGSYACYRTPAQLRHAIASAGFAIHHSHPSGPPTRELFWFLAIASDPSPHP